LLRYKGLNEKGFRVAALFDDDPEKVGSLRSGIRVYHVDELPEVVREKNIQIGIIAVPAPAARAVADSLIKAGVKAILNFAPVSINAPEGVECIQVDITADLKVLSHFLSTCESSKGEVQKRETENPLEKS